jgi:pantoate--beta-alanine ligase
LELITEPAGFRRALEARREKEERLALVPTMGALHAGHLSLVEKAASDGSFVAISIFVNPLQFGDPGDLASYPRDLAADLEKAEGAGVGAVFAPLPEAMYPGGAPKTTVDPGPLGKVLEGASRPGHFAGVATVLTKLFSLSGPVTAYFGEKDFQQLAIVRQLVADLDLAVTVVGCPTVREPDGLALSSRNRRLGPKERQGATCLHRALVCGAQVLSDGGSPEEAEEKMAAEIEKEPAARLDYAVAVEPSSLEKPGPEYRGELRLLVAAALGEVRLIDNLAARR